jgi:flagellar basal body P-ring formation protein FlgA
MTVFTPWRVFRAAVQPTIIMFGLVISLLVMNAGQAVAMAPEVRIDLHAKALVDGESILLGHIADIRSEDTQLAAAIRKIDIGRAPLPGQSLLIDPGLVKVRLKQNNIDPERCRVGGKGPVSVLRNHVILSAERVRAAVEAFIHVHAPWAADQMKIRPIQYDQDQILPCGHMALQIRAPKHTDWLGAIPLKVTIQVDGQTVRTTGVPIYIEVWQDVVLAAKPLGRNQPIMASDVRTERMNLARVPSNAILRKDQVLGRRANRSIAVNSVLRSDQVELPPAVRRGDVVQVLAESARLKITTQGIAQENGGIGDYIRVLNSASKKSIHARVVDSQTVQVDF